MDLSVLRLRRDDGMVRTFDIRIPYILLSLVVEHTAIIVYFHNLKYDLQFQKGLLHQFETEGWTPKYILRQGSPVKVRLT